MTVPPHSHPPVLRAEVMAAEREWAEAVLRELQQRTARRQAYRGHVLSLEEDCYRGVAIRSQTCPPSAATA